MRIKFDDLNKIVEVPDDADDSYIDDVYDDLQKSIAFKETPKIEPSGNILSRAAKFASQAESGGREFFRNPLGGTDSYMSGFQNPEQSEPFAQQFIRQELEKGYQQNPDIMSDKNTIPAYLKTMQGNLIGTEMDTALNPLMTGIAGTVGKYGVPAVKAVASSPVTKAIGKSIGKASRLPMEAVRKTTGWFVKPWQKVSEIDKFKSSGMSDIAERELIEESTAKKLGSFKKQSSEKIYGDEPLSSLESEKSYLERGIQKFSDKEAVQLQEDLPKLYRKRSDEFGEELGKLVGDRPIPIQASKITPQLENSLLKHGVLKLDETGRAVPARAPIDANEKKIYNMYRNFKIGVEENPEIIVDASDLLKSQQSMKVPFGKKFGGSDVLMSEVKKNVSGVLEDVVPGLKQLRSSHAPYLKGKYSSMKELNPFSNQYETGKATGFLEKYAKGGTNFDPDEKRLIGFLEEELGREINPVGKAMGNRLSQSASRKSQIQSELQKRLSDIDKSVSDSITSIKSKRITSEKQLNEVVDEMIRKNNIDKWVRGGVGTALGIAVKDAVFGKVLKWYSSNPSYRD